MKNSIGYAYGYEGLGFQANNPKYMLRAAYPNLVPIFGLVASGLFGTAYACTNVVMSQKSKKWNKKSMLSTALFGMALAMFGTANSVTLSQLAFCRLMFGIFAAGINAPIYQLIATNFPPKYRSTANSIENIGYYLGGTFASIMVLAIKRWGWRSMYWFTGTLGMTLFTLTSLFVKNPAVLPDPIEHQEQ